MSARNLESSLMKAGVDVPRLGQVADGLAAAVAIALPWSTSATSVLIVLWLIALVPTLDVASVRREVTSAAGGLPVLVWTLAAIGMLWSDVSWSERVAGMAGYHKLLVIPLLLAQFRRSGRGHWVILGFLASSIVLLVVSWALVLMPGLSWRGKELGVPVKNYIVQSAVFAICAFGLIGQAAGLWRTRVRLSLVLILVAAAFLANIGYVITARTTLVVILVMLLLFGWRQFGWKGAAGAILIGAVLAGAVWASSPNLRARVSLAAAQLQSHDASKVNVSKSVGLRLEYWKKSLALIAEAPVIGHGTGTIPQLFQRDATAQTDAALITTNPHGQILAVAIELGLVGAVALIAMWIAHFALFRGDTLAAWFGLLVVISNVVSSLFNSHLFDFSEGWLYVLGVGIAGGMAARGGQVVAARPEGKDLSAPRDISPSDMSSPDSTSAGILVPISVGELMDKIAILEIKSERIKNPRQLENIARELGALRAVRLGNVDRDMLGRLSAELKQVNARLWDIEDAIRECDARGDFGESFIELARAVYRLNDERARLKKAINVASGSHLMEEKSYKSFHREESDQRP
jgi:O-antigen ligase